MATNDFKPFSIGAGANVMTQSDWVALAALATGFQSGKASSAQINKALRQGTVMASVLAQFIADSSGADVLDDGNTALILSRLKSGLLSASPGRLLGVKVITSSGTYTPTAGTKSIVVECQGGGGAGGGSTATTAGNSSVGSGGSEGCYGKSLFTNLSSSYSVTIGSGGVGVSGGNGGAGGASSFGSLLTAGGGLGGGVLPSGSTAAFVGLTGSTPPTVTGANIFASTYAGTFISGTRLSSAYDIGTLTGLGGRSIFGDGGGNKSSSGSGNAAVSYGGGGGGAKSWVNAGADIAYAGGNGAKGVIIVWEYA
ncbi:glycine-rich domain-containing protein [Enterobacter ludwigii]